MKLHKPFIWGSLLVLALTAVITLEAFTGGPDPKPAIADNHRDTVPQKRNKVTREDANDRDLDKELRSLDKAKEQLERLKEKDWEEMQRRIEESVSSQKHRL